MEPQIPLTKKERKELKRQEKSEAKDAAIQSRQTKRIIRWVGWGTVGVAVIGGLIWLVVSRPKTPESDIVSRTGFHWHPELTIYVKGEKLEIPENIGIGAVHQSIHTHDDSGQGVVHMEFQGLARKQDTTPGQFFKNWGKDFNSFGTLTKMIVNGAENTEYENYVMHDKDKIELYYD